MTGGQSLAPLRRITKDLAGREACELSDVQVIQRFLYRLPAHCIGEDKREVALDRLEAREFLRNGLTQRQRVKTVEINLAHINGLPELARLRFSWIEFAKPGNSQAIGNNACRPPGVKPCRDNSRGGGEGVEVERARSKFFHNLIDRALQIIEVDG